ncbi:MAG: hypothetical protein QXZ17_14640 [Nitrososphaerota archaeon]
MTEFRTKGRGKSRRVYPISKRLYKGNAKYVQMKKFEEEYGKERGDYIYGAVVGKVKREQLAKKKRMK